jgi:hypothetical protein
LKHLGVSDAAVADLLEAAAQDRSASPETKTLGQRTLRVVERVAASGLKVGVEIAKPALTSMLLQYLGLPHV